MLTSGTNNNRIAQLTARIQTAYEQAMKRTERLLASNAPAMEKERAVLEEERLSALHLYAQDIRSIRILGFDRYTPSWTAKALRSASLHHHLYNAFSLALATRPALQVAQ